LPESFAYAQALDAPKLSAEELARYAA